MFTRGGEVWREVKPHEWVGLDQWVGLFIDQWVGLFIDQCIVLLVACLSYFMGWAICGLGYVVGGVLVLPV